MHARNENRRSTGSQTMSSDLPARVNIDSQPKLPQTSSSLRREMGANTDEHKLDLRLDKPISAEPSPIMLIKSNEVIVPHMQFLLNSTKDPHVNMHLNIPSSDETIIDDTKKTDGHTLRRTRSYLEVPAISKPTPECPCLADPQGQKCISLDYADYKPRRFIKEDVWMVTNTVRERAPAPEPNQPLTIKWGVPVQPYSATIPDYSGPGLNYWKIARILNSELSNRRAVLLQALRWRITKSAKPMRDAFIAELVFCDLLGLRGKCPTALRLEQLMWPLTHSQPSKITDAVARLLNTLCSCPAGRDYVASHSVVSLLVWGEPLRGARFRVRRDPIAETTAENLMGCMHKLAHHHRQRKDMLHKGFIVWLLRHLHDIERSAASVYHIECAFGLLRLLVVHTPYRPSDFLDFRHLLAMFGRYLHSGLAVCRTHVRAILLAMLQHPGLAAKAKVLECDRMIEQLRSVCPKGGSDDAEYGLILSELRKTHRVVGRNAVPVHHFGLRRSFAGAFDPQIDDNDPVAGAGLNGENLLKMLTLKTRPRTLNLFNRS